MVCDALRTRRSLPAQHHQERGAVPYRGVHLATRLGDLPPRRLTALIEQGAPTASTSWNGSGAELKRHCRCTRRRRSVPCAVAQSAKLYMGTTRRHVLLAPMIRCSTGTEAAVRGSRVPGAPIRRACAAVRRRRPWSAGSASVAFSSSASPAAAVSSPAAWPAAMVPAGRNLVMLDLLRAADQRSIPHRAPLSMRRSLPASTRPSIAAHLMRFRRMPRISTTWSMRSIWPWVSSR